MGLIYVELSSSVPACSHATRSEDEAGSARAAELPEHAPADEEHSRVAAERSRVAAAGQYSHVAQEPDATGSYVEPAGLPELEAATPKYSDEAPCSPQADAVRWY